MSGTRNPVVPEVAVVLDRERHLRLDMNAMELIEEELHVNLLEDAAFLNHLRVRDLKVLVWAMLVHEDDELDAPPDSEERRLVLKRVGSWVHSGNFAEIGEKVNQTIAVSMPEETEHRVNGASKAKGNDPKNAPSPSAS